ncbi:MAG: MFS transporter [Planctomycetes bacterium]|nr:MFS transporter [Planctomycetota bacterium]
MSATQPQAPVPPPGPRERFAWCLFDFANSAFNTLVVTFVYVTFFQAALAKEHGDALWGAALTVSGIVVAVISPIAGAAADRRRNGKKRWLVGTSVLCVGATALLALPSVGADGVASTATIAAALLLFVVANVGFELMFVFYNAFLPELGDETQIGRLSGKAWALGYAGGLCCLAVGLGFVGGLELGGTKIGPWLDDEAGWNVRATNLLVAAWFCVFALPALLFLRDRGTGSGTQKGLRATLREVGATFAHLRGYPDLLRLLIAHLVYNDAVLAIIGLAALYMQGTLGMNVTDVMVTAIGLNVAAGFGAFAFGWIDDKVGARTAIAGSLVLLLAGAVLAIAVPTPDAFRVAAALVGLGLGPNQSASRSLMARFAPAARRAEFFGIFSLSGKATAWVGTLLFTVVVATTGDQRLALAPLVVMLALGLVLTLRIDQRRGEARARETPA